MPRTPRNKPDFAKIRASFEFSSRQLSVDLKKEEEGEAIKRPPGTETKAENFSKLRKQFEEGNRSKTSLKDVNQFDLDQQSRTDFGSLRSKFSNLKVQSSSSSLGPQNLNSASGFKENRCKQEGNFIPELKLEPISDIETSVQAISKDSTSGKNDEINLYSFEPIECKPVKEKATIPPEPRTSYSFKKDDLPVRDDFSPEPDLSTSVPSTNKDEDSNDDVQVTPAVSDSYSKEATGNASYRDEACVDELPESSNDHGNCLPQNYDSNFRLVTALYDFEPSEPGELLLREGDLVLLFESMDENWSRGVNISSKAEGIVPNNYLSCEETRRYIAIHPFQGQEPEDLSFLKDEEIWLIEEVDEHWAQGVKRTVTDSGSIVEFGIFPLTYVAQTKSN